MTDMLHLPAATDDNQFGAHLCRLWDEQRAAGMTHGKWCAEQGRFVTLEEWIELQEAQKGMQKGKHETTNQRFICNPGGKPSQH